MPELTPEAELEALRRTVTELLAKKQKYKQKVADLEAANAALSSKMTEANASIQRLTIDNPLRSMAEALAGDCSELFTEQLTRYYNVALADGSLALLDKEDKPLNGSDGKPVCWERESLTNFLANGPQATTFQRIILGGKASGAGGTPMLHHSTKPSAQAPKFGLR